MDTDCVAPPTPSFDADEFLEMFEEERSDSECEPAGLTTAQQKVKALLPAWHAAQLEGIKAVRTWTIDNWNDYLTKTGGRGSVPATHAEVAEFFSGVWGNFWTDAPDKVVGAVAGKGIADAAEDAAKQLGKGAADKLTNVATKLPRALAAGAGVAGAVIGEAAGPVGGLIMSSILATVVEICVSSFVNELLGTSGAESEAFDAGNEQGIAKSANATERAIQVGDDQTAALNEEMFAIDAAIPTMSLDQLESQLVGMAAGIDLVGMRTSLAGDLSLSENYLRKWIVYNSRGVGDAGDNVDRKRFSSTLEGLGGEAWLAELTHDGDLSPFGTDIHKFQGEQARMMLEAAGLEAETIAADVAVYDGPRSWTVEVVDPDAFAVFVGANFGATPDPDLCNFANVSAVVLDKDIILSDANPPPQVRPEQVLQWLTIEAFLDGQSVGKRNLTPGGPMVPGRAVTSP